MNIKAFFVFLSRNKAYTLINVLGLSLSLMFVILIGTYTWQEYHVNSQYPKADRILVYSIKMTGDGHTQFTSGGNWRLQKPFRDRYPEIENSCSFVANQPISYTFNGERRQFATMFTDTTLFSILDIPFIIGDARTALNSLGSAVVTDEFARKAFGSPEKAIGKQLNMEDSVHFRITSVIPQFEHSSVPKTDVLVRFENVGNFNGNLTGEHMNNFGDAEVLFLERKGAHLEDKTADMDKFQKQFVWIFQNKEITVNTVLVPLSKFYFKDDMSVGSNGKMSHGVKLLVNIFLTVGLVILLFAVFNYINLTNAISDKRAREMAIRRLVGASRKDVIFRLIMESVLLCAFSMIIALFLAWAAVPYTERLLNTTLDPTPTLPYREGVLRVIALILFTIVLGVLAGILPAMTVSKAKPIDVVKGTFHYNTHQRLSKIFIVIQNSLTIILIAFSSVLSGQIYHWIHLPRGYNTANLIDVFPLHSDDNKALGAWYDGLKQLPQVVNVTACAGTPYSGGNNNTFTLNGKSISSQNIQADANFMKVFGLKVKGQTGLKSGDSGGWYDAGSDIYVNRQMLQEEGLPINSRYFYSFDEVGDGKHPHRENVSGVLEDFDIRNVGEEQLPLFIVINPKFREDQWETVIQVQGDLVTAYESVQKLYRKVFHSPLELDHPYIDQQIEAQYEILINTATILRLFGFIALVISVLGLVAISTYYIDGRKKEIAIRKVFGSTSAEIGGRFIVRFLSYVVIAFLIATPITIYICIAEINEFAERAVWWYWIPIAGVIVLGVSYAAVAVQVHHAAHQNPAKNLKAE